MEPNLPDKELFLAAHRTFQIDIRGNTETYIITTWLKGHEAYWKFERVGDMKDHRYMEFTSRLKHRHLAEMVAFLKKS